MMKASTWKPGKPVRLRFCIEFSERPTPRAKQIENLKIDYSSWALRDSNSKYKPVETAKLKGKEVLNTAIEEIEIFGAPENHAAEVLGNDFAKKLQEMSESERKKYFKGMKKGEMVELLMKLTS